MKIQMHDKIILYYIINNINFYLKFQKIDFN